MTTIAIQNWVIIALSLLALFMAGHAWRGWSKAASLRQLILLGPVVCEICATRSTGVSHTVLEPCEGGVIFKESHQFVPARLVFQGVLGSHTHQGSPSDRDNQEDDYSTYWS